MVHFFLLNATQILQQISNFSLLHVTPYSQRISNADSSDHLLSGAVNKRKKAFGNIFCGSGTSCDVVTINGTNALPGSINVETVNDDSAPKNKKFFGRFFGGGRRKKIVCDLPNDEKDVTVFARL